MLLTAKISRHNFFAFLWHASFLAFASNFMDVDTVMPAMIVEAGGNAYHIGIMTAIMLGGSSFTQLFFAPYLSNKSYKKGYLLFAINVRILSLIGLGTILFIVSGQNHTNILWLIFLFITTFSLSGAFANISYTDVLGKSIDTDKRKTFFSAKQVLAGIIIFGSAFIAKRILKDNGYPINYGYLFTFGALFVAIASIGFWQIKEVIPSKFKVEGPKHYFNLLKSELKENKKLGFLLGFINTQGIAISFLPFVMLYAKEKFNTTSTDTGHFLLFKIIGVVLISLLVFISSQKIKYRAMLYTNVLLSISAIIITLFINNPSFLKLVFILGGIIFSIYSITMNGLLLEVSGHENRALYTGFAGAGNLLPALFPLLGGLVIEKFGYQWLFLIYILIISTALLFIYKLDCKK